MGNFSREFKEEIKFDGDTITVVCTRLKRKVMMELAPYGTATTEESVTLVEKIVPVVRNNVVSIAGLVVDDELIASEDALELIIEEAYFSELLNEIGALIINKSVVSMDEEKK